ncbi:hypothetical protein EDC96DRAFT_521005 [Choanephora cucurbitarum]|nr:hypothetical protein EDC96DRAFT_521005 [Choanephora cucurbitarum]
MTDWYSLPLELWNMIFELLPKSDLIQCQLTCDDWCSVVNKIMYTEIILSTVTQKTTLINTLLRSSCAPGSYLKRFYLNNTPITTTQASWDIQAVVHQLAVHCPFLESILVAQPSDMFYQQIVRELDMNRLQHLNKLSYPETYGEALESYTRAIVILRKRITVIKLSDYVTPSFYKKTYVPLMENVADFVCVETVLFEKRKECTPTLLDDLIDALPSLKEIKFVLHQPLPLDNYKYACRTLPRPNMRRFSINRIAGSDTAFMYIMTKFPNLEHLVMDGASPSQPSLLSHPACLSRHEVAAYLSQLKSFRISGIENMLSLALLLNQNVLPGNLQIKLCFDMSPETVQGSLDLDYQHDVNSKKKHVHLFVCKLSRSVQLVPLLKQFGSLAHELTLWHAGEELGDEDDLDLVLEHCPNLRHMHLKNYQIDTCQSTNSSLCTLALVKCFYSSQALNTLSQRLPLLCRLDIVKSSRISSHRNTIASHIYCSMPETNFKLLQYKWSCLRKLSDDMYLQLSTSSHPQRHYKINTASIYPVTSQEYKQHVTNEQVLTINLVCSELECLNVTEGQLSIHHTFT